MARHEMCESCGLEWNVSRDARYYAGVYICPVCAAKIRRAAGMPVEGGRPDPGEGRKRMGRHVARRGQAGICGDGGVCASAGAVDPCGV